MIMVYCWRLCLLLTCTVWILSELTQATNHGYEYEVILPPMPPVIYAQAPSGVQVTVIRAQMIDHDSSSEVVTLPHQHHRDTTVLGERLPPYDATPACFPQYYLYENEWTDYDRFSINRCSGKISTAKYVEKSVGDFYKVIVMATNGNNDTLVTQEIRIEVTPYNSQPPAFARKHYTNEILDASDRSTLVLVVSATDEDTVPPNQEVYFTLQAIHHRHGSSKNPWLYPVTSPVAIHPTNGEIYVSGHLMDVSSPLRYRIWVADGGSPQRLGSANLTLYIRNMSAPRNVRVSNVTENSLEICWSTPLHGTPNGYLVLFSSRSPILNTNKLHRGKLNLTLDQLEARIENEAVPFQFPTSRGAEATPLQISLELQREMHDLFNTYFCTRVDGLYPQTSYTISVRAWASYGRISMARNPLTIITEKRTCNDSVCLHGSCQERESPPGFRCHCFTGYYGERCQLANVCIINATSACLNGGTCVSGQEHETHQCICLDGYSGIRCEVVNPCVAPGNVCFNGGTCQFEEDDSFSCLCPANFTGLFCETAVISALPTTPSTVCEDDQTNSPEGVFDWPATSLGSTAFLPCFFGLLSHLRDDTVVEVEFSHSNGTDSSNNYDYTRVTSQNPREKRWVRSFASPEVEAEADTMEILQREARSLSPVFYGASRVCIMDQESGLPHWLPPDVNLCRTAEEEADEIINVTASSRESNATVIASSVKKIAHLVRRAIADTKVAKKMVSAISHILDANTTLIDQTNRKSPNSTNVILATLDEYTSNVPLQPGEKIVLRSENLVVEAQLYSKEFFPNEVTFNPLSVEEENDSSQARGDSFKYHTDDMRKVWIKVPKMALENATQENIRLQFISFKNDLIFRSKKRTKNLDHRVLSASVNGAQTECLPAPVSYMVPIQKLDPMLELPKCVFWDVSGLSWSTKGVRTLQTKKGEVFCEADHLTSFSVLLDPIGSPIAVEVKPALSIITYIGIALSTLALIATIVTFALFRSMNRDRSGLIVMNLSMALLLLNFGFLGSLFITSQHEGCVVFGALLHYAVAASFSWMLIEAVNMYQLLVTVFPSSETHFMRKRVIFGWGVPLIFVVAALIWERHIYFTEYQSVCVISSAVAPAVYYTTYLGPICLVLLINFIVFLRVLRVLCQGRPSYKRSVSVTIAQIRGAVAIVTLLGITWLLGIFAVGQFRMVSQFLFCLTTPFQGLIIFWVRVMQSAEAKMSWKSFLTTGSTRLRPRPPSSLRTNSSTHHSSSLHTHSTDMSSSSQKSSSFVAKLKAARRGFIGSSRMKYDRNSSSKDSTKKLRKSMSNGLENRPTSPTDKTQTKSQSVVDKQYRRLSNRSSQESPGSNLSNGKAPRPQPVIREDLCHKEVSSHETNHEDKIEQEPLKDLHRILDSHPFFCKKPLEDKNLSRVSDKSANGFEESVLTSSALNAERHRSKQPSGWEKTLENERNSVSTSNLNGPKKSEVVPRLGKRSLESLRKVVFFDPRIKKSGPTTLANQDYPDLERGIYAQPSKPKSKKEQPPSFQNKTVSLAVNENCNHPATKSLSDPEINGPRSNTLSTPEQQQYPYQQPHDVTDEFLETEPLTDVVPFDSFKGISTSYRATSEQNIGPDFKTMEIPRRLSVSNVELDSENPQENLLPR